MTEKIHAAPAGAVLYVVQASASMARPVPAMGGRTAWDLATAALRDSLARLANKGSPDVAAFAVRGSAGSDGVEPLLPGTRADRPFVSLGNLTAAGGLADDWPRPASPRGEPRASMVGLAFALARMWFAGRSGAVRPLVVLLGDEHLVGSCDRIARSLRHLRGPGGPASAAFCVFSPGTEVRVPFLSPGELPSAFAALADLAGGNGQALLSLNDDPAKGIYTASRLVPTRLDRFVFRPDDAAAPPTEFRLLMAPKRGNRPEENEDGLALSRASFAAADGASQGIYSGLWARTLVALATGETQPDPFAPSDLDHSLREARSAWYGHFDYAALHPMVQDKIDEVGAAATLVHLTLRARKTDFAWKALAVGDACLFLYRNGRMYLSFPSARPDEFGATPELLRTLKKPVARPVTAGGLGKPGDLFVLATDAVARFLLACEESPSAFRVESLWDFSPDQWDEFVRDARQAGRLENDDSSALLVRVTG